MSEAENQISNKFREHRKIVLTCATCQHELEVSVLDYLQKDFFCTDCNTNLSGNGVVYKDQIIESVLADTVEDAILTKWERESFEALLDKLGLPHICLEHLLKQRVAQSRILKARRLRAQKDKKPFKEFDKG